MTKMNIKKNQNKSKQYKIWYKTTKMKLKNYKNKLQFKKS